MIYTWDIRKWITRMFPWVIRKEALIAWLYSLLKPVETVHGLFLDKCIDLDLRTRYSSQQKLFAAVLNNVFDLTQKRIRVETPGGVSGVTVFFKSEAQTPVYTYFKSEGQQPAYGYFREEAGDRFHVYVPSGLSGDEARIKAWINYYKLADKVYKIIYF